MESAHAFRLLLKKYLGTKGAQKPTNGIIWIAKTYPPWQCYVFNALKEMYEVSFLLFCYMP